MTMEIATPVQEICVIIPSILHVIDFNQIFANAFCLLAYPATIAL